MRMAHRQLKKHRLLRANKTIHHSDRGSQYLSEAYAKVLGGQYLQSFSAPHAPQENAIAERLNGILKQEYALDSLFKTFKDCHQAVKQAIYLYNTERPQRSLDYMTPSQVFEKGYRAKLCSLSNSRFRKPMSTYFRT